VLSWGCALLASVTDARTMIGSLFSHLCVIVRGGGDLGSGVIYRLARAGLPVIVLERDLPTFVRRAVCFGEAVFSETIKVEGVRAQRVRDVQEVDSLLTAGIVPVVIDPGGEGIAYWKPQVVIDARMEKHNPGTTLHDAPLVIALGPGYTAGVDCHAVIETNRGHDLGRVIWQGSAESDTGEPGVMGGHTHSRVLRAPAAGHVRSAYPIGELVQAGDVIAQVAGQPIVAAFTGVLRGILHEQVAVTPGMKIGDLDPRAERRHCFTISDKSLAVGGGALEAVLNRVFVQSLPFNPNSRNTLGVGGETTEPQ
jgi:xanthine dehydrogenase accessory factor